MGYKARTLVSMLDQISSNQLLLPHIQRAFVWEEEQVLRLFDSLMRNYPVQTLLFWKTKEAIKARKFMHAADREADISAFYDKVKSDNLFVNHHSTNISALRA